MGQWKGQLFSNSQRHQPILQQLGFCQISDGLMGNIKRFIHSVAKGRCEEKACVLKYIKFNCLILSIDKNSK